MYIQLNSQVICYEKTGEGTPVILIHGNKEDHHIFDELVEVTPHHMRIRKVLLDPMDRKRAGNGGD